MEKRGKEWKRGEKRGKEGKKRGKEGKIVPVLVSVPGTFWNIPDCWLRKYKKNESRMSLSPRLYKVQ